MVAAQVDREALEAEVRALEGRLEERPVLGERVARLVVLREEARVHAVGAHGDAHLDRAEPVGGDLEAQLVARRRAQLGEARQVVEVVGGRW